MGTDRLSHPQQLGIDVPEKEIAEFCARWHIAKLSLFGSVLRDDFRPDSDVNVLLDLEPGRRIGLIDLMKMEEELKGVIARNVMIITRPGLEKTLNEERRQMILESAEVIYARR